MATDYHAVFPSGTAANAAEVESRFASLDAGIGDAMSFAVANNAELVAARSPYPSLDARLDALVMAGGNVATKANGVSAAGQKVLTVDATDGFIVGAYVTYLLNGTTLEGNLIASIQPGVSLTLTTNIGTGGVLDDSYISMISTSEYLAAQAIPHAGTLMLPQTMEYANGGVFNVKAYGATGNGSTSDQSAIEAAIAAAKLAGGGVVYFAPGAYRTTGTLTIDASNIYLQGAARGKVQLFGDHNANIIKFDGGVNGFSYGGVERMTVIGRQSSARTAGAGISMVNVGEWRLSDLVLRDCYDALLLEACFSGEANTIYIDETVAGASHNGVGLFASIANHFHGVGVVCSNIAFWCDGGVDTATFIQCGVQYTATVSPTYGFRLINSGGLHDPRLIKLVNCYCEVGDSGIAYDINEAYDVDMVNCYSGWGNIALNINNAHDVRVTNGSFSLCKTYGVVLNALCRDITITGLTISDCAQTGLEAADGIYIVGGASNLSIIGCRIGTSLWSGVSPSAGVYQKYGINLASDINTDYITITNNDLSGNYSSGLHKSTLGAHVYIANNLGVAPPVLATGTGKTVDNVIAALQALNLVTQA